MSDVSIPFKTFQKMTFLYNAIEDGWTIRKRKDNYIFTKKHENRLEIFQENYLESFIKKNGALICENK
jgi:transposase